MSYLGKVLQNSSIFFLLLLLSAIAALGFAADFSFQLNASHPAGLNIFFINYTCMGDGVFVTAMVILFLFLLKDKKTAAKLFFSFLFSELLVQLIKNNFDFHGFKLFVEEGQYLFISENTLLSPVSDVVSGHTALAFMISTSFVIRIKDKKWHALLFFAAAFLAFSRMYLALNSVTEVIIGAFTGTVSALFVLCCLESLKNAGGFFKWNSLKEPGRAAGNMHSISN